MKDDSAVPNEYAAAYVRNINPTDTFLRDFPVKESGKFDSLRLFYLTRFEKSLGLKSLDKGFDSIQIHILFGWSIISRDKLIILTHNGKKWNAELLEVEQHYNPVKDEIDSISRRIAYPTPKSGWVKFINKLFELKVLTIEDCHKIPGFNNSLPTDATGIDIEIATKTAYRFYGYIEPDDYIDKYWQAANIVAIKNLMYAEFSVIKNWDKEVEEERLKKMQLRNEKVILEETRLPNVRDSIF